MPQFAARIDVRAVPPRDRHPVIFSTFAALPAGRALELVNDHDPKPLFHHFDAAMPGQFGWDYLEQGPQVWRVAITRKAGGHAGGGCCGGCGGA